MRGIFFLTWVCAYGSNKFSPPGIGLQVLVLVSIYQGKPLWVPHFGPTATCRLTRAQTNGWSTVKVNGSMREAEPNHTHSSEELSSGQLEVKIDIQKLCTGRRASAARWQSGSTWDPGPSEMSEVTQDINKSLLTSSTPRVPETPETRDTSREVTFAMPLKAASALVPAAPAASVAPAAPVAPGATVAAPARASVAPVTAPSAAAPVVASPPAPKTDSPMVAQLVLAEAETTAPDMRQGHEEKNLQAEQEAGSVLVLPARLVQYRPRAAKTS